MSIRLQIIVIACMLFAIIYIAVRLRKKTLSYKFGIWWIMIFVFISPEGAHNAVVAKGILNDIEERMVGIKVCLCWMRD